MKNNQEDRERELIERDFLAKRAAAWKMAALETLHSMNRKTVMTAHPKRDEVIGKEDIINLKIALEVSPNLEEFLKQV